MKFYSTVLKKFFDCEKDCLEAEDMFQCEQVRKADEEKKRAEERKARAKEVEDAFAAAREAVNHYNQLKDKFCDDYGSFHMTFSNDKNITDLLKGFDDFFRFF